MPAGSTTTSWHVPETSPVSGSGRPGAAARDLFGDAPGEHVSDEGLVRRHARRHAQASRAVLRAVERARDDGREPLFAADLDQDRAPAVAEARALAVLLLVANVLGVQRRDAPFDVTPLAVLGSRLGLPVADQQDRIVQSELVLARAERRDRRRHRLAAEG